MYVALRSGKELSRHLFIYCVWPQHEVGTWRKVHCTSPHRFCMYKLSFLLRLKWNGFLKNQATSSPLHCCSMLPTGSFHATHFPMKLILFYQFSFYQGITLWLFVYMFTFERILNQ